jgi:hypothetical protein
MFVNFQAIIATLGQGATFTIANQTRAPGDYLFETLLPERNLWSYQAESGSMTIRATMAGLVGSDSSYPPGGVIDASTFIEQIAKIANLVMLTEGTLRQLQQMMLSLQINNQPTTETLQREVLNFLDKVVIQPHIDTFEWLRGQALCHGAINWTFNNKDLVIDYGVPAGNILPVRTAASHEAYFDTASKFWADVQSIRRTLRANGVRAILVHPDTVDDIRFNPVNELAVVNESNSSITGTFTQDVGDQVTLVVYGNEAEVLDPADTSKTLRIPFMERGKLVGIGNNQNNGFRVGMGGTLDPNANLELGYTHIGPTIEGGGRPGRWADLRSPDDRPWSLEGRAVTNGLPVIEAPEKIVIATTEMST